MTTIAIGTAAVLLIVVFAYLLSAMAACGLLNNSRDQTIWFHKITLKLTPIFSTMLVTVSIIAFYASTVPLP